MTNGREPDDVASVPSWDPSTIAVGDAPTVSRELVRLLGKLGVEQAYGVVGGAIAAFCRAVWQSPIQYIHCRHETGAVFAALEASLATGKPTLVFVTTGPGITNAMTGMLAAQWEGATVILVSAVTSPSQRGRAAAQETSAASMPFSALYADNPVFDFAAVLESAAELPMVAARLTSGVARGGGFVAHLGLPISVQSATTLALPSPTLTRGRPAGAHPQTVAECVDRLRRGSFVIWTGFGARGAASALRRFVEATGAPVISSPRGKGIFPESHPRFVGVTGLGGHGRVEAFMASWRPEWTLVLGSRLGEGTSAWTQSLAPRRGFIHVDLDDSVFGAAYQMVPTYGVEADVEVFLEQLLEQWPQASRAAALPPDLPPKVVRAEVRPDRAPVRPQAVMDAVQRVVVNRTRAIILAESGNSFVWATHFLEIDSPHRYRVSPGFGAMGHTACGVVGAALGSGRPAVAIVGDGAMLMQNEVSTAVQYRVPAVWIVLNDAVYSICDQGMRSFGWDAFQTELPETNFALLAEALGARGVRVDREDAVEEAIAAAVAARCPFVVDVRIDREEWAPASQRNKSLLAQGI